MAQQLCSQVNLFPPKICLSFSPTVLTKPTHDSSRSNSDGHICGTSSNCSWFLLWHLLGPFLVSVHNVTAVPTAIHVIMLHDMFHSSQSLWHTHMHTHTHKIQGCSALQSAVIQVNGKKPTLPTLRWLWVNFENQASEQAITEVNLSKLFFFPGKTFFPVTLSFFSSISSIVGHFLHTVINNASRLTCVVSLKKINKFQVQSSITTA